LHLVGVGDVSKRILVGRKLRSAQLGETLLPKRIALPVFASDALSSVAYAPDEVFIMLGIAGFSAYQWSWKIALGVAVVMLTVVTSYRQTVHAYPSGGGDYEVASVNLGRTAGMTVASALLVDYILTVAVSISAGAQYAAAAIPALQQHEVTVASVMVLVLAALRLLGLRNAGTPLELASTPVSAAQPDENARASRKTNATVVSCPSQPGAARIFRSALSTGGRSPPAMRRKPQAHMPRIAAMKR